MRTEYISVEGSGTKTHPTTEHAAKHIVFDVSTKFLFNVALSGGVLSCWAISSPLGRNCASFATLPPRLCRFATSRSTLDTLSLKIPRFGFKGLVGHVTIENETHAHQLNETLELAIGLCTLADGRRLHNQLLRTQQKHFFCRALEVLVRRLIFMIALEVPIITE